MSAPLIVAPLIAVRANAAAELEQHLRSYDPVRAGFDDTKEQPVRCRRGLVSHMLSEALRAERTGLPQQPLADYVRSMAVAVVDTASSTGSNATTPSVVLRAMRWHARHEAYQRAGLEGAALVGAAAKYAETLGAFRRTGFRFAIDGISIGRGGAHLSTDTTFYRSVEYAQYGARDGACTVLPVSSEALLSTYLEDGTAQEVAALDLAMHGLRGIVGQVDAEQTKMNTVVDAVRAKYPDFGISA